MGTLVYDTKSAVIPVEDRTLAHLRIVVLAKFRRHESFAFNWTSAQGSGGGRGTIWLAPGIAVYFHFEGSKEPVINREWIDLLMRSANSTAGLSILPEPVHDSRDAIPVAR
jgi:hypothetical protein